MSRTLLIVVVIALLVVYVTSQAKKVATQAVGVKAGAVNSAIAGGFGLLNNLVGVFSGNHSSSGGTRHSSDGAGITGGSVHSNPVIGTQDHTAGYDPDSLITPDFGDDSDDSDDDEDE